MTDQPEHLNIGDFIGFLESENFTPGTANANRNFIYQTLEAIRGTSYDPNDIYEAYASVGVTVPASVFSNILATETQYPGQGNAIRTFFGNGLIPGDDLQYLNGDYEGEKYIMYFNATYTNSITGDEITTERYLTFSQDFTPNQLRQAAITDYETGYNVKVKDFQFLRMYQIINTPQ